MKEEQIKYPLMPRVQNTWPTWRSNSQGITSFSVFRQCGSHRYQLPIHNSRSNPNFSLYKWGLRSAVSFSQTILIIGTYTTSNKYYVNPSCGHFIINQRYAKNKTKIWYLLPPRCTYKLAAYLAAFLANYAVKHHCSDGWWGWCGNDGAA